MSATEMQISRDIHELVKQLKETNKHLADISKNLKDARILVATDSIQTLEPINIDPRFTNPTC